MLREKQPVASTVPEEGATGWADTTMMHVDAANPNCAYMWMEHSLSPKVQGDLAAWFGSNPAVPAACKGNALLTEEGCKTNGFENFEKIKFWKTPVAKCATQGECVPYYRWVSDYIGVIGGGNAVERRPSHSASAVRLRCRRLPLSVARGAQAGEGPASLRTNQRS